MRWYHCGSFLANSFEQCDQGRVDEILFEKHFPGFSTFGFTNDFHEFLDLGYYRFQNMKRRQNSKFFVFYRKSSFFLDGHL
jgi:hypothetical protein